MEPERRPPGTVPTHLVVKLRSGWRCDASAKAFTDQQGQTVTVRPDLPSRSRVEYMVPHLAEADPASLGPDERDLARYVHLLFPKGSDAREYLDVVRSWKCVEDVELPPDVSLP